MRTHANTHTYALSDWQLYLAEEIIVLEMAGGELAVVQGARHDVRVAAASSHVCRGMVADGAPGGVTLV